MITNNSKINDAKRKNDANKRSVFCKTILSVVLDKKRGERKKKLN